MSEHTKGPWAAPEGWGFEFICPASHAGRSVGASVNPEQNRDHYMQIIAAVSKDDKFGRGKREANAHLIAAAPDLLEALEEIVAITDRKHVAWDRAKTAIAKAKGRLPPNA